ncbi:MAG TPA: ABC transporter substrate-binding protein [Streptosporangiaceae bacterium]|jgi:peptide/nickel transport system substrate-binding protein
MGAFPGKRQVSGKRGGTARKALAAGGAAALVLTAAACGSSSSGGGSGSASTGNSGGTKTQGGTATYALPPNAVPNYIFPFDSSTYFSTANAQYFQYLMYRPLYWFGNGASPTLNTNLSLAEEPKYDGDKVTITMKDWKWSNGESITAQDVVFWIHMLQAEPDNWGASVPGGFPSNVSDVTAVSPTELTMEMNKSYNHTWFTYNELSQITPMPKAWDRTANGASDCANSVSDCSAVYSYLDSQSKNGSTWASSPLWSVVDGPWKLQSFNASGNSTFVPNDKYGGTKPTLSQFKELPFTTESAEYNVLRGGGNQIDVGYMPTTDAPSTSNPGEPGSNPVNGYYLSPLYEWSINYFPVNENSTTGNGPVDKQLYFRQALQYLVNQEGVIRGPLHGYGYPTVGPVGTVPATDYLSAKGKQGDPFPYNVDKAKQLLTEHGWDVKPNGVSTCQDPAKCGDGVKKGHGLEFNLPYATGTGWIEEMVDQLQSNASLAGIKINVQGKPFNQVTAIGAGNCVVVKSSCDWDMVLWGGGWSFAPDYYPSGETLFMGGSAANSSGFEDAQNDSLINQTLTANALDPLYQWQDYLSTKLPENWLPNGVYELTEVANNLQGVLPQNSTGAINPENWYFTK